MAHTTSCRVEGPDLAQRIKQHPLACGQAVHIVALIADALHYAHTRDIVHRDAKPGNILLERDEHPCVADFGLALKEADLGTVATPRSRVHFAAVTGDKKIG